MIHVSQYVTNSSNMKKMFLAAKFISSSNNEDQEALGYKTLKRKDVVTSYRKNKALGHFRHVFSIYDSL